MALVSEFDGFIFDYGGVLVHQQTEADQARMAAIANMDPSVLMEAYWADRHEYDKGSMSAAEYWRAIAKRGGRDLNDQAIEDLSELDATSWMNYDPPMWEWIEQLRAAGKRAAILSNMPKDLGEALRFRTERLNYFDHVTLSYELHSAKPEPAIYEHCLEGLGTDAGRTLFLDDKIVNVQAAEVLGIRSIQFTSRDEVFLRLRA